MKKIAVKVSEIDKEIIKKIQENEMITLSLLAPEFPEYHISMIWKRVSLLKGAGIIQTIDGMYQIADGISITDKTNEIVISPDMLNITGTHVAILKLLYDRGKKTKFAFIRHKLKLTQWKALHNIEMLIFLGMVRKEKKGIYEITPIGKQLLEDEDTKKIFKKILKKKT